MDGAIEAGNYHISDMNLSPEEKEEQEQILHLSFAEIMQWGLETTFWGSIAYSIVLSTLAKQLLNVTLPTLGIPLAGFMAGGFMVAIGAHQMSDTETHRPNASFFIGLTNVLNGFGLVGESATVTATTALGVGTGLLGPAGFAASVGISFALSLAETFHRLRRLNTDYWLKDNFAQLNKLDSLIEDTKNSIKGLTHPSVILNQIRKLKEYEVKKQGIIYETKVQIQSELSKDPSKKTAIEALMNQIPHQVGESSWREELELKKLQLEIDQIKADPNVAKFKIFTCLCS